MVDECATEAFEAVFDERSSEHGEQGSAVPFKRRVIKQRSIITEALIGAMKHRGDGLSNTVRLAGDQPERASVAFLEGLVLNRQDAVSREDREHM